MKKEIRKIFVERLKELMVDKNVNVTKLAIETKIPRTSISNWLNAGMSPQVEYLCAVADFFGCSVDYLLGRED